ncbi:hypothetical protein K7432_008081 [Basidiobolus ranarum]|uniref:Uncharacterized protein n=1 Tax=Basidiobolus ranarum TaxID=34480 RepID=A0ABR2WSB6_9FUNG
MISFPFFLIIAASLLNVACGVNANGKPSATSISDSLDVPDIFEEDTRAECTQLYRCGEDQACIAQCYGVPSPDTSQVIATLECYVNCQESPTSVETCQSECLTKHYQPIPQNHPVSIQPSPPSPTGAVESKPLPGQNSSGITRKRAEGDSGSSMLSATSLGLTLSILDAKFLNN